MKFVRHAQHCACIKRTFCPYCKGEHARDHHSVQVPPQFYQREIIESAHSAGLKQICTKGPLLAHKNTSADRPNVVIDFTSLGIHCLSQSKRTEISHLGWMLRSCILKENFRSMLNSLLINHSVKEFFFNFKKLTLQQIAIFVH